jgi:hypothetical protein
MEKISTCLHRLLAVKPVNIHYTPDGCGDCSICTKDEKNKECSRYTPISVSIINIEKSASFFSNFD